MVEEKVYCSYIEEHHLGQGHRGESRVDMTLYHLRKGGWSKEREKRGARRPQKEG